MKLLLAFLSLIFSCSLAHGAEETALLFLQAAEEGNLSTIKTLMTDTPVDIDSACCHTGETALFKASSNGHEGIVCFLLQNHASVDQPEKRGLTPLLAAARGGFMMIVEQLKEYGADLNHRDNCGWSALFYAASCAQVEIVQYLIGNKADPLQKDNARRTPYEIALSCEHPKKLRACDHQKIAHFLIEAQEVVEANKHQKDPYQELPFLLAVREGNTETLIYDMDRGADPDKIISCDGEGAMCVAARYGQLEVLQLLVERGATLYPSGSRPALLSAVRQKQKQAIGFLLAKEGELNLNDTNKIKDEALLLATRDDGPDPDVVRTLIEAGASVNAQDRYGWTPLIAAINSECPDIVIALLFKKGALVNQQGCDGKSPLMIAAYRRNPKVVSWLLATGADIRQTDCDGKTALHYLLYNGLIPYDKHPEITEMLLEKGADMSQKDAYGYTPEMLARKYGYSDITEIFKKHLAKAQSSDKSTYRRKKSNATL